MQRLVPYLGVFAALFVGGLFIALSGSVIVERTPIPSVDYAASSTLSVVPSISLPAITLPSLELKEEPLATSSAEAVSAPNKVPPPPIKPAASVEPAPAPVAAPVQVAPATASSGDAGLDAAASALRAALVNIMCYVPQGSGLRSISGSGIFVDSKGVILTNAHIAQYFLLKSRGASCIIRSGSPATDKYRAALMYVSPAWIRTNAQLLTQANPSGTGEYDFALLAVTRSATNTALPSSFPFVPLATLPPYTFTPVVIASYGAQFLESSQVQSALSPTVVFGSVKDVFTFATNTIDVLALGGSAAAQEGSSGGGVADANGKLVGTITTSTVSGDTSTRSLDAITASYIRAEYASETGSPLDLLLERDPVTAVTDFASQAAELEAVLTAQLSQ